MANNAELKKADVVKRMIEADALEEAETLRVRVFPKAGGETSKATLGNSIPCIIADGKDHIKGRLIGNAATLVEIHDEQPLVLLVESFVASLANVKDQDALVYISAASIHSRNTKRSRCPTGRMSTAQPNKRIQGGIAPAFLSKFLHVLPDESLGCAHLSASRERMARVSNFLAQHSAMVTLYGTNNTSSHTAANDHLRHYMLALKEFKESQMYRQKASLTSNSGREDAARSNLIVEQHSQALNEALADTNFFTTERLCAWHAILCGQGIHEEAGRLRRKVVRVGHVHFRHQQHVEADLSTVCRELRQLERRFLHARANSGIAAVTLAAAVLFALVDVHAFCDGNGRLARIALNWCLRRFGFPFVVHLFATPAQRNEYREAIIKTRRNLALVGRGHCSEADVVHALEEAGAFAPMVELIVDRLYKTIVEFGRMVEDFSRIGSEEADLRAARRVRDRERAGTCLICFDDNPNIATLCCGKAIHLNCVAQWLSSNNTCPNCRDQFPALSPRIQAPSENSEDETTEDETTEDDEEDDLNDTDETIEMEDDTTSETTGADENPVPFAVLEELRRQGFFLDPAQRGLEEGDDTASAVDEDETVPEEDVDETTESISADDTTTSNAQEDETTSSDVEDTTAAQPRLDLPAYCCTDHCRNRAARDCHNAACGRCCQLHGRFHCPRHNT